MKATKSHNQLEQFFREDPMYLKKYVREHPDNKMAWYLLGREYDSQGKRGKALYCYSQAGEIYEAYENQQIALPKEQVEPIKQWGKEHKRRSFRERLRLAMVTLSALMLLLYIPPVELKKPQVLPYQAEPAALEQAKQTKVYYLTGGKSKEHIGAALQMMLLTERMQRFALLAKGSPIGESSWIGWLNKPELLLSVTANASAAQQHVSYYDAESCDCEPSDSTDARRVIPVWQREQEQELVLRSSVAAYMKRNGKPPEDLAELSLPYPNNMLPGVTERMREWYAGEKEKLLAELGERETMSPDQNKPSETKLSGNTSGGLTKPLAEPIRIIVDKQVHRLAVISGPIILRSYPVGLGGERTPEDTFIISEKVRNPNGRSNGEFGSRGMTLSDTLYAIHGTNKPLSIGKDQSLGCVRMLKEDVEELFDMVPIGTPVTIGKGLIPADISRSEQPFQLPPLTEESNPGKRYQWLD